MYTAAFLLLAERYAPLYPESNGGYFCQDAFL